MKNDIHILVLLIASVSHADSCAEWFKKSLIKPGKNCVDACAVLPTGMDTFSCPRQCKLFCDNRTFIEKLLGSLAYYPGLTEKERDLIAQYPNEAVSVYQQKGKAESATYNRFGRDAQGDESDAFRHFVWAALLSKEIGPDRAKEFLDAHETGQAGDPNRAMDLANNRAGLAVADRLRRSGRLNESEIESEAIKALGEKTLVVLNPRGGPK